MRRNHSNNVNEKDEKKKKKKKKEKENVAAKYDESFERKVQSGLL